MELRNRKRIDSADVTSSSKKRKSNKSLVFLETTDESDDAIAAAAAGVAAVNKLLISGNHCANNSYSYSSSNAPTLTTPEKETNGGTVREAADVVSASESSAEEVHGPVNILDMSLSEVANMFDFGSSLYCEDECTSLVVVGGYRVGKEFAAAAQTIFSKHGDILSGTAFTGSLLKQQLLENICAIYQKLGKSDFGSLMLCELETMRRDVDDCAKVNMGVGWLAKRLDEIYDAKNALQQCHHTRNDRNLRQIIISELEKELNLQKVIVQKAQHNVENIVEKLGAEKAKSEATHRPIMELKQKVRQFNKNSLVDGLL